MLLPHLVALLTHHSHHPHLPLSFTPGSRPTSFTNLTYHRLPSSLRTDSTDFTTGQFLLSISVFVFLSLLLLFLAYFFYFIFVCCIDLICVLPLGPINVLFFCLVPCSRLSRLLVSFWAHVNIVHRIRIVSYRGMRHSCHQVQAGTIVPTAIKAPQNVTGAVKCMLNHCLEWYKCQRTYTRQTVV